jgi:hypothetical protein
MSLNVILVLRLKSRLIARPAPVILKINYVISNLHQFCAIAPLSVYTAANPTDGPVPSAVCFILIILHYHIDIGTNICHKITICVTCYITTFKGTLPSRSVASRAVRNPNGNSFYYCGNRLKME